MNPVVTIFGGYGAIGRVIGAHLAATGRCRLVIAGRDEVKAQSAAREIGGEAIGRRIDVLQFEAKAGDLGQVVLNASGPSWKTSLPAARIALAAKADFVDLGGYDQLRGIPPPPEPFRVLVSAGWMPGVSELLSRLAVKEVESRFGQVRSLDILCGARDTWAAGSSGDMVWHLLNRNDNGYFEGGKWHRVSPLKAFARNVIAAPVGSQWTMAVENSQAGTLAVEQKQARITTRLGMIGWRTMVAICLARLIGQRHPDKAARVLARAISVEADGSPLGFCEARAKGVGGSVSARITTQENLRLTAVAGAEAVLSLLDSATTPSPGVHYLGDAVDPAPFLSRLADAGFPHVVEIFA